MQQSIVIIVLTIYLWHLMILYVFLWFNMFQSFQSHKEVTNLCFALISCQISRIASACNSCRKTLGFPMNFIAATAPLKEGHASNLKSVHAEKNPRNLGLCSLRCFFPITLITPSDSYQLPLNPFEFGISRYPHNYQSPFPIRSVFFFPDDFGPHVEISGRIDETRTAVCCRPARCLKPLRVCRISPTSRWRWHCCWEIGVIWMFLRSNFMQKTTSEMW